MLSRRRNARHRGRHWCAAPSTDHVRKGRLPLIQGLFGVHREQDGLPAFEKENVTRKELQGRIILKKLGRGRRWGRDMK